MKLFLSIALFALLGTITVSTPVVAATDITPPKLVSAGPSNAKTCVNQATKIAAVFNEAMDPFSINTESLTVTDSGGFRIAGRVEYKNASTITRDLSLGSSGDDVTRLQQLLIDGGLLGVATPNGYFGYQTKAAVVAWQKAAGIDATGVFGPASRAQFGMAVFSSSNSLAANSKYIAAITTLARDAAGNAFTSPVGWYFVTGPTCATGQTATVKNGNTLSVKFNPVNLTGGPSCTTDNTVATATFTTRIDPTTLTPESIYLLDPFGKPIRSEYRFLHLDGLKMGLAKGSRGNDVKRLQVFLHTLGFFTRSVPTENFGNGTKLALMTWQKSIGIKATGVFDAESSNHANVLILIPTAPLEEESIYTIVATQEIQDYIGNPLLKSIRYPLKTAANCKPGTLGLRGPIGIPGIQGIQGILGPIGPKGLAGAQGLIGQQGATGTTGITGETGIQGSQGGQGSSGAAGTGGERVPYLFMADLTPQHVLAPDVGVPITFSTFIESYGIDHTADNPSRIYTPIAGLYYFVISLQLNGGGELSVWARQNGIDIPYSAALATTQYGYNAKTLLYPLRANAGDYFEFIQSSSDPTSGIAPVAPSDITGALPGGAAAVMNVLFISP